MEQTTAERTSQTERLQAPTVTAAFRNTAREISDRVALRTKGDEFSMTWGDYFDRAAGIAGGLAGLGLKRGDTIGLMLTNRPEFHIADAGALLLGLTPFSIYNTFTPDQIEYLVKDAENTTLITEKAFLPVIEEVANRAPGIEHIVVCDEPGDGQLSFEDLAGKAAKDFDADAAVEAVEPDDILTLIYTSGTTGPPKGVQITHENVMSAVRGFDEMIDFPDESRIVSYLPMAHIAERMVGHYLPAVLGATVTDCPDPRKLTDYIPEVRPNWFFAVPRIWEKMKSGIEAQIANDPEDERREATQGAIEAAIKKVRLEQAGEEVPEDLAAQVAKADEAIFSRMREKIGLDDLVSVNVGAAPTAPEVLEFFHAIGIPVAELWGMSETCGSGTVNPPDKVKIGTVGPAAPNVELKLAEDGEVLMRGPMVMKGYRNQPDKTKETIDDDGWLHTGDIGQFDEDDYLKIVDRKKEIIINAAGKNLSPANIEAKLKNMPLIGQACAIGDRQPYIVALLVLDPEAAPAWAKKQGIEDTDIAALAENERVLEEVQKELDEANEDLARVEQIKKFKLLPEEWEPGGDELTPTMKLKRKPVAEKYAQEIEALYAG